MIFISKNLKFLRKRLNLTQEELAEKLNVKANTISNYEKSVSQPDIASINTLMEIFNVSSDALLFKDLSIETSSNLINTSFQSSVTTTDEHFTSIPLVDISVAAGCCGYDNPDYLEIVDTIKMPLSMVHSGKIYFCVRIKGESMSPTLLDSSYVIVRLLDRSEWQDMPDQHIYVISDTDGRSYIKRIKNRFRQHGFLVCMSDNVDKINYPNFNLEAQEINTILHAEWYFSAKMPNLNETYYDKVNQLEDDMDVIKSQMQQLLRAINVK